MTRLSGAIRTVAIVAAAAPLLWISIGVSGTLSRSPEQNRIALSLWPWGAKPQITEASLIVAANPDDIPATQIREIATAALMREPVNASAAKLMGLSYALENNAALARKYFQQSEVLSRRDLTAQLWLLEDAVSRDDVETALRHYDKALRTSKPIASTLFPILASALDDENVSDQVIALLQAKPLWSDRFLSFAIPKVEKASVLMEMVRKLDFDTSANPILAKKIVARLDEIEGSGAAYAAYQQLFLRDRNAFGSLLTNGDFSRIPDGSIFDWRLRNGASAFARRESAGGGTYRLHLVERGERGGTLASQNTVLAPGTYVVKATAGGLQDGTQILRILVSCTDPTGSWRQRIDISVDPKPGSFSREISVPAGCVAQQFALGTPPARNADLWISDLAVVQKGSD